jgi:hypothetical protein
MKRLTISMSLTLLLIGCGGRQEKVSVNNSQTPTAMKEALITSAQTPTPTLTPTPATNEAERPVEFTYLGLTSDKQNIHYTLKVNTAQPISQVDLYATYRDDDGKALDDTMLVWQNIVKSKRLPIEKGKTYDVEDYLPQGATKVEITLQRVVFTDGTYWATDTAPLILK